MSTPPSGEGLPAGTARRDPDAEHPAPPLRQVSWTARAILALVVVASMVAGWFIATAFLPRWWAQRVADVVDGSASAGLFAGLTCGVVFTAGPLLLLRPVVRRRTSAGARLAWLVAAALLAVPNLATLGIALDADASARDGRRLLDTSAPWFSGSVLAGAVVGVLAVLALWFGLASYRRQARELQRLRAELRRRDAAAARRAEGGHDGVDDGADDETFDADDPDGDSTGTDDADDGHDEPLDPPRGRRRDGR